MWTSVPQIPARRTRIRTSLMPVLGASISSSHKPGSRLLLQSAFMNFHCRQFDMLHGMLRLASAILFSAAAFAQLSQPSTWAVQSQNHYAIRPNITYGTWTGYDAKLDVYQRRDANGPQPTLMFIHGG